MHNINFFLITVVCVLFMFSCGGKDVETEASPDFCDDDAAAPPFAVSGSAPAQRLDLGRRGRTVGGRAI